MTLDQLTEDIESRGLRWDVGLIGHDLWEARIWEWPNVIVRKRLFKSQTVKSGMDALRKAYSELDLNKYPKIK